MKKKQLIIIGVAGSLVLAGGAGAAALWWSNKQAQAHAAKSGETADKAEKAHEPDGKKYKYVSLEKVIVMLRSKPGETPTHYLAMDLVFKTAVENEKTVKDHLPLLRSLAVRSLSSYTLDQAGQMSIDNYSAMLNKTFTDSYKHDGHDQPFAEAMIGKLIIE